MVLRWNPQRDLRRGGGGALEPKQTHRSGNASATGSGLQRVEDFWWWSKSWSSVATAKIMITDNGIFYVAKLCETLNSNPSNNGLRIRILRGVPSKKKKLSGANLRLLLNVEVLTKLKTSEVRHGKTCYKDTSTFSAHRHPSKYWTPIYSKVAEVSVF